MALITVSAYGMFLYLVIFAGPVFASQTAYVVTLSGVLWGIMIFDDEHSLWVWLSLGVMMLALGLVTPRKDKSQLAAPPEHVNIP
jgi:drug/metabolite transporter (DMT)-like permease